MEKGTWVVCINDSNWAPGAYTAMSDLPVKNELYQVREFVPQIPGLMETDGIKLEGIKGEEEYFVSNDGKVYWIEYHFSADRFQAVNDLWVFLILGCDTQETEIHHRRNRQKLFDSLVNNGYENLTEIEMRYWDNVN